MSAKRHVLSFIFVALGWPAVAADAQADPAPVDYAIQIDEEGTGSLTGPDGAAGLLPSNVTPPPLSATFILTYYLPSEWQPVPGDVYLRESGGDIGDLIRFNEALFGAPATIEFYSHYDDGSIFRVADNAGWPSTFYINTLTIPELNGSANYRPTAGQPGYVSGLNASYTFVSEAPSVPEPGGWAMMLLGLGTMGLLLRHRRRRVSSSQRSPREGERARAGQFPLSASGGTRP